jgi:hypothetical protein
VKNKLEGIKDAKPPTDIKTIKLFIRFCRTHIKDFVLITSPLFKLKCKNSSYKLVPLPEDALKDFYIMQKKQLTS